MLIQSMNRIGAIATILVLAGDVWGQVEDDPPGGPPAAQAIGEWVNIFPEFPGWITDMVVDPHRPERLYLVADGLYKSLDGGATWAKTGINLAGSASPDFRLGSQTLIVDPRDPSKLYGADRSVDPEKQAAAIATGGLLTDEDWTLRFSWSEDYGRSWSSAWLTDANISPENMLATTGAGALTIFVAGADNVDWGRALYRSTDRGATFERVEFFAPQIRPLDLYQDPAQPNRIYVASRQGIFISSDGGGEWLRLDNVPAYRVVANGQRLYAVREKLGAVRHFGESGVYRSDDLGGRWELINPPQIFPGANGYRPPGKIAVNPANPDIVYVTIPPTPSEPEGYIIRSRDGGATWTVVWVGGSSFGGLVFDPADPSLLYAQMSSEGLLKVDFDDPAYEPPAVGEEIPFDDLLEDIGWDRWWRLARVTNLGPKAGNGGDGYHMGLDRRRDKLYIGNKDVISIADLQLGLVTDIVRPEELDLEIQGRGMSVAFHAARDELYVYAGPHRDRGRAHDGGGDSLYVLDPNTLRRQRAINLRLRTDLNFRAEYVPTLSNSVPMLLDERGDRVFMAAKTGENGAASVTVVDLASDAVEHIPLFAPPSFGFVGALAVDPQGQKLYALLNLSEAVDAPPFVVQTSQIYVVDLENLEVETSIELPQRPRHYSYIAHDPTRDYLYAVAHDYEVESSSVVKSSVRAIVTRLDTRTQVLDGELAIPVDGIFEPRIALDAGADALWVSSFTSYDFVSRLWKVDLGTLSMVDEVELSVPETIANFFFDEESGELFFLSTSNLLYRARRPAGPVDQIVVIGADPTGVAVSEAKNQAYVSRGGQGGFYVLNAAGDIIRSVAGGKGREIFVDDIANRIYFFEQVIHSEEQFRARGRLQQLGVYDLTSLRRLHTTPLPESYSFDAGVERVRPDYKRGVLWPVTPPPAGSWATPLDTRPRLDLFTGALVDPAAVNSLADGFARRITSCSTDLVIDAERDRAYMGLSLSGAEWAVGVYDLNEEVFIDLIDLPLLAGHGIRDIRFQNLGLDVENQRLYMEVATAGTREGAPSRLLVVDIEQRTLVGSYPIAHRNLSELVYDFARGVAYRTRGDIYDLETFAENRSFSGLLYSTVQEQIEDIALNRISNAIYGIKGNNGLALYLGPAGTQTPPPPTPEDLVAEAGDEEVVLSWSSVDDESLVGYHAYRQDRSGTDFVRVTRSPVTAPQYRDVDLVNGQVYAYRVSSVGQYALESEPSASVAARPEGQGDFRLLVLKKSAAVAREDSVSLPISLESLEGFDGEVGLTAVALEGLEVVFAPERVVVPPKIVEVRINAAAAAPLGRVVVTLRGEGGERMHEVPIAVEVTDKELAESVLTLELDQESVPIDLPLLVSGRLFPGLQTQVQVAFTAERADTLIAQTVNTDVRGEYRFEFQSPFADTWQVAASWPGTEEFTAATSRAVEFAATSGTSRITATSDLVDDADLGFIATLKGRIYPTPGTVGVSISVRRPDGTLETIEGVLSSPEGFYGHDIPMDQAGIWEVWASWKGNGRLLGANSPVIPVPVQTDVGRVILLAGGRDAAGDLFWPTSNYLGNMAYTTFQRRRLVKEKMFYLNDRQAQDVDRDGFQEDVDAGATMGAWEEAWDWARTRVSADSPLYVYLVGKGSPIGLEIGAGENLTVAQLLEDVNTLEGATGVEVTLIVEASHSGNFIRDLSNAGRPVIASTGSGLAFYQAEGFISFSQYFLTDLFQGKSLQEAFVHSDQILRNLPGRFRDQDPGLEAEGNLIPNQPGDYLQTIDAIIGAPFELGDLSPEIKTGSLAAVTGGVGKRVVTQNRPITKDPLGPRLKLAQPQALQGVEIAARVDDAEGSLQTVRAIIIPPAADDEVEAELTAYPEIELLPDGSGRWVGIYNEFLAEGLYPVIIYALDSAGNAAEPLRTTVLVEPPPPLPTGDFDGDGLVEFSDFFMFADAFGTENPAFDLDGSGMVDFADFFLFADAFGGPLGKLLELAEEMLVLPTAYALSAPYPNPFNSEVVVRYSLPRECEVELVVYNALGQVVRRLVEGHQRMGHHRVVWDGRDGTGRSLATGTYIVEMKAGEWLSDGSRPVDLRFRKVRKVAFLK